MRPGEVDGRGINASWQFFLSKQAGNLSNLKILPEVTAPSPVPSGGNLGNPGNLENVEGSHHWCHSDIDWSVKEIKRDGINSANYIANATHAATHGYFSGNLDFVNA
jgi:hypothetical protein